MCNIENRHNISSISFRKASRWFPGLNLTQISFLVWIHFSRLDPDFSNYYFHSLICQRFFNCLLNFLVDSVIFPNSTLHSVISFRDDFVFVTFPIIIKRTLLKPDFPFFASTRFRDSSLFSQKPSSSSSRMRYWTI